jgi:hypothetical protein
VKVISAMQYQSRATEADFQRTVIDMAQRLGWLVAHWPNAVMNPIWPDLTLIKGRRVIFAELKTERGKLGLKQAQRLAELETIGAEVYVWRPSMFESIEMTLRGDG